MVLQLVCVRFGSELMRGIRIEIVKMMSWHKLHMVCKIFEYKLYYFWRNKESMKCILPCDMLNLVWQEKSEGIRVWHVQR